MLNHLAHISEDGRIQTVEEHARNTAEYAAESLRDIGLGHAAYLCGLLHDCGKMTEAFQNYLHANGSMRRGSVNHTFAGPKYILERFHQQPVQTYEDIAAELLAYAMAAHHGQFDAVDEKHRSGLQHRRDAPAADYEEARRNCLAGCCAEREIDALFEAAVAELTPVLDRICSIAQEDRDDEVAFYSGMLARLLLSAVVEGDRRDTSEFFRGARENDAKADAVLWEACLHRVEARLEELPKDTQLQQARRRLSEQCRAAAESAPGIFRLNLPTGGGKTLSGLRFALAHAKAYGKARILFASPLLSILDQNAEVIRRFVQNDDMILEHHSNIVRSEEGDEGALDHNEFLAESWNAPIIITTLVQLLNTLFQGRNSSVRRMHALCNSVIVIDEVQTVPQNMLTLFNLAVNFLAEVCKATVVLCSATQPCLEETAHPLLKEIKEIVPCERGLWSVFDRTEITDAGACRLEDLPRFLADILANVPSLLVVCNRRSQAEQLFRALDLPETRCFHLSAGMCTAHRRATLQRMQKALQAREQDGRQPKVICVSTQVVEAGVDLSFGCVVRLAAGLDNIIQAAGRCNRNGELAGRAPVYIIRCEDENLSKLKQIKRAQDACIALLDAYDEDRGRYANDLASDAAVTEYYRNLYRNMNKGEQDFAVKDVTLYDLLSENNKFANDLYRLHDAYSLRQAFKTAGQYFKVFDEDTRDVVVPYGEGAGIINHYKWKGKAMMNEALREYIEISPEVRDALENNKPVIAMETTIVAQGFPYPENVEMSRSLGEIARSYGVVPAPIGILNGKIIVGMSDEQVEYMGKNSKDCPKGSRRDLAAMLALKLNGATTSALTVLIARMVGIDIFCTGGLGGVHRGASETFDISADLDELGRTRCIVVSAGAKAILDLPKTLEYLETKGVTVLGYRTDILPAFYSSTSPYKVDYRVDSVEQAAAIYKAQKKLGIESGIMLCNPVEKEFEVPESEINPIIEEAVREAEARGVHGKDSTPFILAKVKDISAGRSLQANIKLVQSNVRVASELAIALCKE